MYKRQVLDKVGTYGMIRFCLELFPGCLLYTSVTVTRPDTKGGAEA